MFGTFQKINLEMSETMSRRIEKWALGSGEPGDGDGGRNNRQNTEEIAQPSQRISTPQRDSMVSLAVEPMAGSFVPKSPCESSRATNYVPESSSGLRVSMTLFGCPNECGQVFQLFSEATEHHFACKGSLGNETQEEKIEEPAVEENRTASIAAGLKKEEVEEAVELSTRTQSARSSSICLLEETRKSFMSGANASDAEDLVGSQELPLGKCKLGPHFTFQKELHSVPRQVESEVANSESDELGTNPILRGDSFAASEPPSTEPLQSPCQINSPLSVLDEMFVTMKPYRGEPITETVPEDLIPVNVKPSISSRSFVTAISAGSVSPRATPFVEIIEDGKWLIESVAAQADALPIGEESWKLVDPEELLSKAQQWQIGFQAITITGPGRHYLINMFVREKLADDMDGYDIEEDDIFVLEDPKKPYPIVLFMKNHQNLVSFCSTVYFEYAEYDNIAMNEGRVCEFLEETREHDEVIWFIKAARQTMVYEERKSVSVKHYVKSAVEEHEPDYETDVVTNLFGLVFRMKHLQERSTSELIANLKAIVGKSEEPLALMDRAYDDALSVIQRKQGELIREDGANALACSADALEGSALLAIMDRAYSMDNPEAVAPKTSTENVDAMAIMDEAYSMDQPEAVAPKTSTEIVDTMAIMDRAYSIDRPEAFAPKTSTEIVDAMAIMDQAHSTDHPEAFAPKTSTEIVDTMAIIDRAYSIDRPEAFAPKTSTEILDTNQGHAPLPEILDPSQGVAKAENTVVIPILDVSNVSEESSHPLPEIEVRRLLTESSLEKTPKSRRYSSASVDEILLRMSDVSDEKQVDANAKKPTVDTRDGKEVCSSDFATYKQAEEKDRQKTTENLFEIMNQLDATAAEDEKLILQLAEAKEKAKKEKADRQLKEAEEEAMKEKAERQLHEAEEEAQKEKAEQDRLPSQATDLTLEKEPSREGRAEIPAWSDVENEENPCTPDVQGQPAKSDSSPIKESIAQNPWQESQGQLEEQKAPEQGRMEEAKEPAQQDEQEDPKPVPMWLKICKCMR